MFENLYGKNNKLVNAVLQQIENHRNGEEVDTTLLKGVVESFGTSRAPAFSLGPPVNPSSFAVTLGMNDENGTQRATLDLYRDKFQTHFLAATEAYYKKESEAFLAENSISDYLKKVEARLEEEARRVDLYLHNSTTKGVSPNA